MLVVNILFQAYTLSPRIATSGLQAGDLSAWMKCCRTMGATPLPGGSSGSPDGQKSFIAVRQIGKMSMYILSDLPTGKSDDGANYGCCIRGHHVQWHCLRLVYTTRVETENEIKSYHGKQRVWHEWVELDGFLRPFLWDLRLEEYKGSYKKPTPRYRKLPTNFHRNPLRLFLHFSAKRCKLTSVVAKTVSVRPSALLFSSCVLRRVSGAR